MVEFTELTNHYFEGSTSFLGLMLSSILFAPQTRPMYELYSGRMRMKADIIVPDGVNTVVLGMIVSRLKSFISYPAIGG